MQQRESLFWYFEFLRQPSLQSFHGLLQGQGELEAGAGGGVDVQIHGGLSRDGLAGRSPATGAAPGTGMLVHPITCGQRREDKQTSRAGDEEGGEEETGEADPSLRLPSRVLLTNVMQHSGSFLSVSRLILRASFSRSQRVRVKHSPSSLR